MQKIRISELAPSDSFEGLYTIGYTETAEETEGGEAVTTRRSVRVSLEEVGGAADAAAEAAQNANNAATNASAAAKEAETQAEAAGDAATTATEAANEASTQAQRASDMADKAEDAAANATTAADRANTEAQNASDKAAEADSAATNASAAAQSCYDAIEKLGDLSGVTPITDEEIDELLKNFNFLDSYTVSAAGEYPLTLDAANTSEGANITGSVDIEGIPADEVEGMFK